MRAILLERPRRLEHRRHVPGRRVGARAGALRRARLTAAAPSTSIATNWRAASSSRLARGRTTSPTRSRLGSAMIWTRASPLATSTRFRRRTRKTSLRQWRSTTCRGSMRCTMRATSTWSCTSLPTRKRAISPSSSSAAAHPCRCRTCCPSCSRWVSRSPTSGPYEIERRDGTVAWIYDFGLRHVPVGDDASPATLHERFQDALAAAWHGRAEVDGFQALVLEAGLTWRQVTVLRAYAKYLRQAGYRFSQAYLESALRANTHVVRLLVSLFEADSTRRSPATGTGVEEGMVRRPRASL